MALPLEPVGVALFDNPASPSSGWLCAPAIHGATAERFSTLGDLRQDVIWVLNLDDMTFNAHNMLHSRHVRRGRFLRVTLKQIAAEFALDQVGADRACAVLAGIVWRCLQMATTCGFASGEHPVGESLSHTLRDLVLQRQDASQAPQELMTALRAAHQSDSSVAPAPRGSQVAILRRNRMQHASEVLSCATPVGQWRFLTEKDMPSTAAQRLDWAARSAQPILVRAAVSRINPEYLQLVAFGNSMGGGQGVTRQWLSQPELIWLREFADIRINAAFVADRAGPPPINFQAMTALTANFGLPESAAHLCPSVGLFLENLLYSLMLDVRMKGRIQASFLLPHAVWLRAVDRALCFCAATRVAKAGMIVLGYGNGAVRVAVQEGGTADLLRAAGSAGLAASCNSAQRARISATLERAG